jgi:hypothetical protein
MQFSTPLRRFLLACSLALFLPGCKYVERIDANGNPINKPANKPVVATHVTPAASPARR